MSVPAPTLSAVSPTGVNFGAQGVNFSTASPSGGQSPSKKLQLQIETLKASILKNENTFVTLCRNTMRDVLLHGILSLRKQVIDRLNCGKSFTDSFEICAEGLDLCNGHQVYVQCFGKNNTLQMREAVRCGVTKRTELMTFVNGIMAHHYVLMMPKAMQEAAHKLTMKLITAIEIDTNELEAMQKQLVSK